MNVEGVCLVNKKSFLTEKHHMTFVQAQIRMMLTNQRPGARSLHQSESRTGQHCVTLSALKAAGTARAAWLTAGPDHNIAAKYRAPDCSSEVLHVCSAGNVQANWGLN